MHRGLLAAVAASMILLSACAGSITGPGPDPMPGVMCGPENCAGCCVNGTCENGANDAACGTGGIACQSCRDASMVCLPAQVCGTKTMGGPAMWQFTVVGGGLTSTVSGMAWDQDGSLPDSFLVVDNYRTPTAKDTGEPKWNYMLVVPEEKLLVTGFAIQVFDDDGATNDKATQPRTFVFKPVELAAGKAQALNWDSVLYIDFAFAKK